MMSASSSSSVVVLTGLERTSLGQVKVGGVLGRGRRGVGAGSREKGPLDQVLVIKLLWAI